MNTFAEVDLMLKLTGADGDEVAQRIIDEMGSQFRIYAPFEEYPPGGTLTRIAIRHGWKVDPELARWAYERKFLARIGAT